MQEDARCAYTLQAHDLQKITYVTNYVTPKYLIRKKLMSVASFNTNIRFRPIDNSTVA